MNLFSFTQEISLMFHWENKTADLQATNIEGIQKAGGWRFIPPKKTEMVRHGSANRQIASLAGF